MQPFDPQPHLRGTLVELVPMRAEHVDTLAAVASDPLIWEQHPDPRRHEPARLRAFLEGALASGGTLVAIDLATGAVIGSSRYHGWPGSASHADEVEIGWTFLARSHWGGRYNGEMKGPHAPSCLPVGGVGRVPRGARQRAVAASG